MSSSFMRRPDPGFITLAALLLFALAGAAQAAPTDPVTVTTPPTDQGEAFVTGFRELPLPEGWIEEEYLVAGAATVYTYEHNPPLGPTDTIALEEDVPYKTRIVIRRPENAADFNGSLVIEWWNSTAGFDTAPVWDPSADYFIREGYVYVGVTNSTTSIGHLTGGCSTLGLLPPTCGTRYADLSLPDNGVAFEMVSQIAHLLKGDSAENPLPVDFDVERLYHAGQSQQGGSMVTYASAFHFDVNDGYFVQQAASARRLNDGPACGATDSPPFPGCTPRLAGDDRLVRTDLPVPVYHAITETDVDILFGTVGRQEDTETFRYWEVAGGGHLTLHEGVEIIPAGLLGPDPLYLEELCESPVNSTADGPIFFGYVVNALWDAMEDQVKRGRRPPRGVMMEIDPDTGRVARDEHGNGLGGVRLPAMDVPTATYTPGNTADPTLPPFLVGIGNLACRLSSSVTPFDEAKVEALYPEPSDYVLTVFWKTMFMQWRGFLLSEDKKKILKDAIHSEAGCGRGYEAVAIVPLIVWTAARRRRRS